MFKNISICWLKQNFSSYFLFISRLQFPSDLQFFFRNAKHTLGQKEIFPCDRIPIKSSIFSLPRSDPHVRLSSPMWLIVQGIVEFLTPAKILDKFSKANSWRVSRSLIFSKPWSKGIVEKGRKVEGKKKIVTLDSWARQMGSKRFFSRCFHP